MSKIATAPTSSGPTSRLLALVVLTALLALTGCQSGDNAAAEQSPSSAAAPSANSPKNLRALHRGAPGQGEGVVPVGGGVLHEQSPTVANLDPALLDALRRAATKAAADGIRVHVNSGWRSAAHQEQLLQDAVSEYGSEEEASRWVATPQTSEHVSGDAVDIGPTKAASWLAHHGAAYGLCRVYRNEPWHFELRPAAVEQGCPGMYDDPTQDPRMQH